MAEQFVAVPAMTKNAPGGMPGASSSEYGTKFGMKLGVSQYPLLTGRRLVLRNQIGGHATAILNVIALLACPVPDLGGVQ